MSAGNQRYLLDTDTVSYLLKNSKPGLRARLEAVPMSQICISAITEAELWAGLARLENPSRLRPLVIEFLLRVTVLPFDSGAAQTYGRFRQNCQQAGKWLSAMDMLIGAHAVAANATLVSSDKAFSQIRDLLDVENWAEG